MCIGGGGVSKEVDVQSREEEGVGDRPQSLRTSIAAPSILSLREYRGGPGPNTAASTLVCPCFVCMYVDMGSSSSPEEGRRGSLRSNPTHCVSKSRTETGARTMANRADPSARFRGPSSHSGGRSWLQRRRSNRRVPELSMLLASGVVVLGTETVGVMIAASAIEPLLIDVTDGH